MTGRILSLLKWMAERRGLTLINVKELEKLEAKKKRARREVQSSLVMLCSLGVPPDEVGELLEDSRSQLGQDVFAYLASGRKKNGFFVEFGAGDGVALSNTVMLERLHGWTGILAEPLPDYHASIRHERRATLEKDCVWSSTGETLDFVNAGYLSTIEDYRFSDLHGQSRASGVSLSVTTVSLWDLLERHRAPRTIDFLSIDTEGSEFEILNAFPFGTKYAIRAIACEHNYTPARDAIQRLLASHGYRQFETSLSKHDDWFVLDH